MHRLNKKRRFILISILIIVLATVFFLNVVMDIVKNMCVEEVRSRVINIVNYSNDILQNLHFFYDDYFKIEKNSNGDITLIVANTGLINQVNMIMQTEIQNRLNELRNFSLDVPTGVLTGSVFLAKYGYAITIKVQTISNCYTEISSDFFAVGLNQTIHKLVITAVIEIEMVVPTKSIAKNITNDLVLAENIIVGKVPDTYMGANTDTNYLDLLP